MALGLLAAPRFVRAQAPAVRRIGVLLPSAMNVETYMPAFRKRLGERGWVEGKNLALEVRHVDNRYERAPGLAAELVRLKAELLLTVSTPLSRAAKDVAGTTPIVFAWVADPVGAGLVSSLARPSGNATGFSNVAIGIAPKLLELLKTLVPNLERVAALDDPKFSGSSGAGDAWYAQLAEAAPRVGVTLIRVDASSAAEVEQAFAAAAGKRAQAMVIPPLAHYGEQREAIARLGKQYRIATASQFRGLVAAGGLVSYGSDYNEGFLRTVEYVDRILRGARPADLPVQQVDRFELYINRKTAAELGLSIPQDVLVRANEVYE